MNIFDVYVGNIYKIDAIEEKNGQTLADASYVRRTLIRKGKYEYIDVFRKNTYYKFDDDYLELNDLFVNSNDDLIRFVDIVDKKTSDELLEEIDVKPSKIMTLYRNINKHENKY